MKTTTTLLATLALLGAVTSPALAEVPCGDRQAPVNRGTLLIGATANPTDGACVAAVLADAGLAAEHATLMELDTIDGVPTLALDATRAFVADEVATTQMQWAGSRVAAECFDGGRFEVALQTAGEVVTLHPTQTLGLPHRVNDKLTLWVGPHVSDLEREGVATDMYPVFDTPEAPEADWMLFVDGDAICLASFGQMPTDPAARAELAFAVADWLRPSFPDRPMCLESRARDLSVRARLEVTP